MGNIFEKQRVQDQSTSCDVCGSKEIYFRGQFIYHFQGEEQFKCVNNHYFSTQLSPIEVVKHVN